MRYFWYATRRSSTLPRRRYTAYATKYATTQAYVAIDTRYSSGLREQCSFEPQVHGPPPSTLMSKSSPSSIASAVAHTTVTARRGLRCQRR